jgi:hypothetical protein
MGFFAEISFMPLYWILAGCFLAGLLGAALVAFLWWLNRRPQD